MPTSGISRRSFLRASAFGAVVGGAGVAVGRTLAPKPEDGRPPLLRPPGSLPEDVFLKRCIRCGECMAVCPTNTLRPAELRDGLRRFWSPVPAMRAAGCDPECHACARACPTDAIRALPTSERRAVRIGMAVIDRARCLPWSAGGPCDVCVRECANQGFNALTVDSAGRPYVLEHRCTGCGWCEFRCPVGRNGDAPATTAAIVVGAHRQDRMADGSYAVLRERERAAALPFRPEGDTGREFLPSFLRGR